MSTSLYRMFQRRGTQAQWEATNPILAIGEFGFAYDQNIVKMGDGETTWQLLPPVNGDPSVLVDYLQAEINAKLPLAGGTMTGKITLSGDPTQALHAVTKQYVDNIEAGLITRPSVRAATTSNLSGTYNNGTAGVGATLNLGQLADLNIDGVDSWIQYNGILVKNQTNAFENGRYVVFQIGNDTDTDWILRRCPLCDEADEIPGSYIFVTDGTVNEQTGWVQYVADPDTFIVGTDAISVYQFAGTGSVTAGTNVSVSGNQVSVVNDPAFSGKITANSGITNAQQKNASVVSGYNSSSGNFAHSSRVVMTAVAPSSTAPTTRPDGSSLAIGDIWISY